MATKKRIGRTTGYKPEFDDQAYKLTLLGLTDTEMSAFFQISEQTLNSWKKLHPSFLVSIMQGKELADAKVADALYHRALGYKHDAVKIMQVDGEVVQVPYTEHYPPDTQAASLWLRNRQPHKWRSRDVDGDTSKELKITIQGGLSDSTPDA